MPKTTYLQFTIRRKNNGDINLHSIYGKFEYRILKDKTGCVYGILPVRRDSDADGDWDEIGSVEAGMLACQKHANGK